MNQLNKLFDALGAKGIKRTLNWEHKFLRFTLMHYTFFDYDEKATITVLFQVFEGDRGFIPYIEEPKNSLTEVAGAIIKKLES